MVCRNATRDSVRIGIVIQRPENELFFHETFQRMDVQCVTASALDIRIRRYRIQPILVTSLLFLPWTFHVLSAPYL